ncbi:hypothetical protein [Amycolatopsis sp. PS_44_ISF1]|uniref:hypothetical protein n=1 Tax=Amycolatopsis sp. PS_44_ISF1 TaxID=2974917 RepID=UPI0028DEBD44|nr:hypothetical protein [Amycolatopsis sp. PS_44_ISF1]MDT8911263.1 hypothetical protein [Amycolatopsis sp. PS_44_ISF1]
MTTRVLDTDSRALRPRGRTWILRLELRRSTAPLAGGLSLVLGLLSLLYLFSGFGSPFSQWTGFTAALRSTLEIVCPVALAVGAWQGRRAARPGAAELISTTARPAWQRVLPTAGALALAPTAAFLVLFAFGAVQVSVNTPYQHLGWLPAMLVGVLALIASAWLGLGIGTVAPSVFTTPLLAAFGLITLRTLAYGVSGRSMLLGPGLDLRDDFSTLAASVSWGQLLWFGGLAAGGLVLAMAHGRRRYLAVAVIAIGLAGSLPLLPPNRYETYLADAAAAAPVCTADAPRVCVAKVHAPSLAAFTGLGREALRRLAPLADAPKSVEEDTTSSWAPEVKSQASDVLLVQVHAGELDAKSHLTISDEKLLNRMLQGAGTVQCGDPEGSYDYLDRAEAERSTRQFTARVLSAALLLGKPTPDFQYVHQAAQLWPALHALPAAEQQRRLSALRTAFLACQPDALHLLTQG